MVAARIEAERRRAQLMQSAQQLQSRLSPNVIARDAWQGAKEKGADMVENAVDAVRRRPVTAGGIVAALVLFLAREPIMDLAGKLVGSDEGKAKKQGKSNTETVE